MKFIPARNHGPAANYPIQRIVMHGTVSPCVPGGALAIANMFRTTSRDASTQYVVDPTTVVQCVPENVIAYGAPPNKGSIHVEQCDPQAGSPSRWADPAHQAMIRVAAKLVAGLCLKYDIPIKKITATDLKAGHKGICGHADISAAWHQTDHTDPGVGYPWGQFIDLVNGYAHPKPPPAPKPVLEDDDMMILVREQTPPGSPVYLSVNDMTRRLVVNEDDLAAIVSTMKDNKLDVWFQQIHRIPNGTLGYYGIDITPADTPAAVDAIAGGAA